ncbi:hypothetical protein [Staphylococcus simulans]|uniref:hypothetical protein n=1 Tax=Staphylococcus simulans TaxID=1286 RepID=UPI000E6A9165|nr:hypothetical protein [Staphylococcus simulans]RIN44388.1 hypothetical protein BU049_11125 [Staphylococcus simulans]RIN70995.1 hypothetical protein BU017_07565 [Staphylococcus simulans]
MKYLFNIFLVVVALTMAQIEYFAAKLFIIDERTLFYVWLELIVINLTIGFLFKICGRYYFRHY